MDKASTNNAPVAEGNNRKMVLKMFEALVNLFSPKTTVKTEDVHISVKDKENAMVIAKALIDEGISIEIIPCFDEFYLYFRADIESEVAEK